MKIAMIGDLHGNYIATLALEAALKQVQPDEIWFLGDAVGKGPQNAETCDWVMKHCSLCVGGNWDYGIGGKEFPEDGYFWNQLGPERMEWLRTLPPERDVWISGVHFRLFHGRPVTPLISAQTDKEVFTQVPVSLNTKPEQAEPPAASIESEEIEILSESPIYSLRNIALAPSFTEIGFSKDLSATYRAGTSNVRALWYTFVFATVGRSTLLSSVNKTQFSPSTLPSSEYAVGCPQQ